MKTKIERLINGNEWKLTMTHNMLLEETPTMNL